MAFTNAELAQKMSDMIGYWSSFIEQYNDWLGGVVGGGPGSNGEYPLTNWAGTEYLVKAPAQLTEDVNGLVTSASASAAAAAASAATAGTSETNAAASAATATAQAVLADADRIAAESAASDASNSAVTAAAQAAIITGGNYVQSSVAETITSNWQFDGNVGFYGTAPVAQQTSVPVTAAGIHAALVAYGLIT